MGVLATQLAVGEVEAAVHTAHRAIAFHGHLPATLSAPYHQQFAPYRTLPAVRDLLDRIRETTTSVTA